MENRGIKLFYKLYHRCPTMGIKEFELWMLHEAHQMFRAKEITAEEFAVIMDETVCW